MYRLFRSEQPIRPGLRWGDVIVFLGIAALIYAGVHLAAGAPPVISGPRISLSPKAIPYYAGRSLARVVLAYVLSLAFTITYGYAAARNRRAEQVLLPLLDVLQSVPILSFLPVVLLSLSAILPQRLAAELASIVLIFTSQVWNMTFAWYQSLITVPQELREASEIFRFNGWLRFRTVELPFATVNLVWNSMMSWAGGWFFLMAAEIFTVGQRDFRLPGLGAYLGEAAGRGDFAAILWGVGTLVFMITALDQLVWRPLLAWSDRFKLETVAAASPRTSWFYDALRSSRILEWLTQKALVPIAERVDTWFTRRYPAKAISKRGAGGKYVWRLLGAATGIGLLYLMYSAVGMLSIVPWAQWKAIGIGTVATLARVSAALGIAFAWAVPFGVAIGTNPRLAAWLQPVVQVAASVPATALFPVLLLLVLGLPGGLNLAAILLMLMGTQWYLLFNVIAGAAAIPQDLKDTSALLQLDFIERWRRLILPALVPFAITGAITAGGGAWNASIVAEHIHFGNTVLTVTGIGALIAEATGRGDYPLLLAATLSMIGTVVIINRLVWRRLYRLAQTKYRME